MTTTRRIGAEDSKSRAALLDAAQRLMLREGYAAVTSRKVAAEAGLKHQLVHYYFRTMDDLFLALLRRGAEGNLERLTQALSSPEPLRAVWELSQDPAGTAINFEFVALSNHRKAVRAELRTYAERFRQLEIEAVDALAGNDQEGCSPEVLAVLLSSVGRMLVMEEALGLTTGHDELRAVIDRVVARHEGAGSE